jgi:YhcH/YjgK/YiaL family protein
MALFGSLDTVRVQSALARSHPAAFAYLAEALTPGSAIHARIMAVPAEQTVRIELGDGVFVLEQAYLPKPRAEGRYESHLAYIDLQAIVAGRERMDVTETARLRVTEDLTPGRDVRFHEDTPGGSVLRVGAGEVAVFHPADAHMPSVADGEPVLVRKAVVKVPVPR